MWQESKQEENKGRRGLSGAELGEARRREVDWKLHLNVPRRVEDCGWIGDRPIRRRWCVFRRTEGISLSIHLGGMLA